MTNADNRGDRSEFIDAAKDQAFTTSDDTDDPGREIIHAHIGALGADWDLAAVIDAINNATFVGWTDSFAAYILQHHLEVRTRDGSTVLFQVNPPDHDTALRTTT